MKKAFITSAMVLGLVAAILVVFYFVSSVQTTYALCSRDIEYTFVVVDETTRVPIAGARLTFIIEDWRKDRQIDTVQLVSDADGKITMLRKNESCEDVIRPMKKTVTLINLGWCDSLDINADGYVKIDNVSLYEWKYTDRGFFIDEKVQRIELVFPLKPQ